jgi:4-hydroxyphenylacetate 3-monooxygenase oxygenase component
MGARTGEQYLAALRAGRRRLWLDGELVGDVTTDPRFAGAAHSMATLFDLQHQDPARFLMPSPDTGEPVNVTHVIPRSRDDLRRRAGAIESWAQASAGTMGRTPDYLNVTFACFAGRPDALARHGEERGAENVVRYQAMIRDRDLCLTHSLMNPQVDRSTTEDRQAEGKVSLRKVAETGAGIVVDGARMLATLAPYADELVCYPGFNLPDGAHPYAISFAVPVDTPGLTFMCRDSYSKQRARFDYPLSSRFDEMDTVAIFDRVEVPRERVFCNANAPAYNAMQLETNWRAHVLQQAMIRGLVKLEFAFGVAHLLACTTGVAAFDHVQEKMGELWSYAEMARSGVLSAVAGAEPDEGGVMTPDERPLVALRGLMPNWLPRANDLIQLVGGGGFMATPSARDFEGPMRELIETYYQARGADAERRVRLFRLAWDLVGSELAGRGELYERFYLGDSFRMTALAYQLAPKESAEALVERFLAD